MINELKGKIALVTGGDSGIGKSIAQTFARSGARVVIANRSAASGQAAVREIRQSSGQAVFVQTDISQETEIKNLIEGIVKIYGKLDCAVNNAGIDHKPALLHEIDDETWNRVITVNLRGTFLCMKYELSQMFAQKSGVILNVSSIGGLVAASGLYAYAASKGGINQLTRTAAVDYAKFGIRVNALCPGLTQTPLTESLLKNAPKEADGLIGKTPLGRIARPEEMANAAVWLCSDESSYVTGVCFPVDGGVTAA
jgi:NAD(P)-dependent dehydrogenase (short-subunit alcohol dehydrogenase family)